MKFLLTIVILLVLPTIYYAQPVKKLNLKAGNWIAELQLNEKDVLPFNLLIEKKGSHHTFTVINADEQIKLNSPQIINDSIHLRFPFFNSELVFKITNTSTINGYWINYNKGNNYRIPFRSTKMEANRFSHIPLSPSTNCNMNGKWQATFEPNTPSAYAAIGIFKQDNSKFIGTFLTETGDYRFLAGNVYKDSLYLSCFDGTHAFLFKGVCKNDSIFGQFNSGSHWKSEWNAAKNENATLKNPEELTYIKNKEESLSFVLKDINGTEFSYPNPDFNNKVVIIQIMGTWCPNCLDETVYYKQLYEKYHDQGLEIITVAYENGSSFEDYVKNVQRLQSKLSLDFTFLIGGAANKGLASEHFSVLNEVISFPTSIFIGRDGKVKRVHTGFNGPGTGAYYTEYIEQTDKLLQNLLMN